MHHFWFTLAILLTVNLCTAATLPQQAFAQALLELNTDLDFGSGTSDKYRADITRYFNILNPGLDTLSYAYRLLTNQLTGLMLEDSGQLSAAKANFWIRQYNTLFRLKQFIQTCPVSPTVNEKADADLRNMLARSIERAMLVSEKEIQYETEAPRIQQALNQAFRLFKTRERQDPTSPLIMELKEN